MEVRFSSTARILPSAEKASPSPVAAGGWLRPAGFAAGFPWQVLRRRRRSWLLSLGDLEGLRGIRGWGAGTGLGGQRGGGRGRRGFKRGIIQGVNKVLRMGKRAGSFGAGKEHARPKPSEWNQ